MLKRLLLLALLLGVLSPTLQAAEPVRLVFFYSPTCPHCHKVIREDLAPLQKLYGEDLVIAGINIMIPDGNAMFQRVMEHYEIPRDGWGVPAVVIGDLLLQGSREIPDKLPGIIEMSMVSGGLGWPAVAGLDQLLDKTGDPNAGPESGSETQAPTPDVSLDDPATPIVEATFDTRPSPLEMIKRDPLGNTLSIVVLVGLILSLVIALNRISRFREYAPWPVWTLPLFAVIGLGVAGYLAFVEIGEVEAVCGPVGDCNTVQQSPYSRLFGFLPAAVLGFAGYATILLSWVLQRIGPAAIRAYASVAVWGLALLGTLFSIYFTFLEPFVIGATCAWCLTSAVVMALILLASIPSAKTGLEELRG